MGNKVFYSSVYYILFFIYFPGLVFYPFFESSFKFYFNYLTNPFFPLTVVCAAFIFVYALSSYVFQKVSCKNIYYFGGQRVSFVLILISFLYFISAIDFFLNYESSFRHKSRLSDAGPLVTILFALKPIFDYIILMLVIYRVNGERFGVLTKVSILFISTASLISINSSLQVVVIPILYLLIFRPSLFVKESSISFAKLSLIIFVAPLILISVLFIGIGNKIGYDILLSERVFDYIYSISGEIVTRVSTSLLTVTMLWDSFNGDFFRYLDLSLASGSSLISTFQNRLYLLLGTGFDKGLIDTVDRTNFLLLFREYHARAGASPGILGSMYYFPVFPLGFIIIPVFYAYLMRRFSSHLNGNVRVNNIFILSIAYLSLGLFESPLNFFMFIDPIFFLVMFVILTTKYVDFRKTFAR